MSRISPILLLVIVILAAIFFAYGLLHLLVRYLIKIPSFSSIFQSNRRNREPSLGGSQQPFQFQRQLQQLFRLHDSGLDQSLIETLPIFYYKDIIMGGFKEPFDCAVCLCAFSDSDVLRLLPLCSHTFHIHCIDTWLLSNSTCPLCRSLIIGSEEVVLGKIEIQNNSGIVQENGNGNGEMRVFSIRLGKYRNINENGGENNRNGQEEEEEVIRSCNLVDGRRCYSMGTFEYVVGSEVQVALSKENNRYENGQHCVCYNNNTEKDEKKISARTRGESYSVSKIWLWSKKDRSSVTTNNNNVVTQLVWTFFVFLSTSVNDF